MTIEVPAPSVEPTQRFRIIDAESLILSYRCKNTSKDKSKTCEAQISMRAAKEPFSANDRMCPSCGVDLRPFFEVLMRYRQFLDAMKNTKIGSLELLSPMVPCAPIGAARPAVHRE